MQVQSSECGSENANALKRNDPGSEQSCAGDPNVCPGHAKDEREMTRKRARCENASLQNRGAKRETDRISEVSEQARSVGMIQQWIGEQSGAKARRTETFESSTTKSREPGQEKRKFTKASFQRLKANGIGC